MIPNNPNKYIQRVIYVTSVDVSIPNGPGVNEYEFLLAAYKKWGKNFTAILPRLTQKISLPLELNVLWCPPISFANPIAFIKYQIAVYTALRRCSNEENPNLVVLRRNPFAFGLLLALKSQSKPYAIKTASGFPDALWWSQTGIKRLAMQLLSPVQAKLDEVLFQGAIGIDACTAGLAEGIVENYGVDSGRVTVIDNATNIERFYPQNSFDCRSALKLTSFQPIIGYVGGRPWERGAIQLIKVLPELRENFPTVGVLIVGGGNDQEMNRLKQLAEHLNIDKHLVFTGVIPYEQVPQYINCLDVGVAFDRVDTRAKGNSNQKIRQYLACGVPVITSDEGNEFLTDAGLGCRLSDSNDLVSLKQALVVWGGIDSDERQRFKEIARNFAVNHLSTAGALEERIKFWGQHVSEKN